MKTQILTLMAAGALLVGCKPSVESASEKFNSLPTVVQKTIRSQAPNAEIANITTRTENDTKVYEIEFREPGTNPKLVVTADGLVMNSPGTAKTDGVINKVERALTPTGAVGTKFSALPESVQKSIQKHAPANEITDISRQEENGRVIYKIEFKDQGKNPTLRVA